MKRVLMWFLGPRAETNDSIWKTKILVGLFQPDKVRFKTPLCSLACCCCHPCCSKHIAIVVVVGRTVAGWTHKKSNQYIWCYFFLAMCAASTFPFRNKRWSFNKRATGIFLWLLHPSRLHFYLFWVNEVSKRCCAENDTI